MSCPITINRFNLQKPNQNEILRYAKSGTDKASLDILGECLSLAENAIAPSACYKILDLKISGDLCDFGEFSVISSQLAKNLACCQQVAVFGATIGAEFDRLLIKYSKISPTRAVFLQAIGAERVETLCDAVCQEIKQKTGKALRPRFSAGYGDLPLETQKDIFLYLGLEKWLGVTLNESLLMSPSKSVTAFVGIL
ncbi:MAG: Vitamin B12 dependent methionine synthase activation subunit [Clostridia bacterium]|nr:Vitamin B12 dependent methionine synthase activation subunit [Clostridia bacterium]